ncbi:programmed cell death protein 2 [Obelidium mucronatum]|nr:programmed cell death protein 2 [Obelidium mucronatum]
MAQLAFASLDWPVIGGTDSDCDPYLDKIGGSAVWLADPYPHGHPKCKVCGDLMYLLAQVLASSLPSGTPNASLDRILYVFACNKAACSKKPGSFLVLRAIRIPAAAAATAASKVVTPTVSKQPQNPPKFRVKEDSGIPSSSVNSSGSQAVSDNKKQKKKKPSIFQNSSSAFGADFESGFGPEGNNSSFGAFGTSSNAFGSSTPSTAKMTSFGTSAVAEDDEISKLLAQRDKGYNAWMEDIESEPETTTDAGKTNEITSYASAVTSGTKSEADDEVGQLEAGINAIDVNVVEQDTKQQQQQQQQQQQSQSANDGPHFPGYSLEFFDPSSSNNKKTDDMSHELELLAQYQKAESIDIRALLERAIGIDSESNGGGSSEIANDGTAGWEGEVYEKTQVKGVTKAFKTFQKTVAKYPEQCIRYGFKTEPLVYNERPFASPPPCPHCNSARVFEIQLMPALLSFLPVEEYALKKTKHVKPAKNAKPTLDDLSTKGVDFGTLLIYTCSKNCLGASGDGGSVRYVEEGIIVQHDEW